MDKETRQLVKDIRAFLRKHHMAASTFGKLFSNNTALVYRIEGEHTSPSLKKVDEIRKWMKDYENKKD
jgi:hypothetical protein